MKLKSLHLEGFSTAFARRAIEVDFARHGEGIICIVGGNGTGKTHVLEAAIAALYGDWPSYGEPLASHVPEGSVGKLALDFELRGVDYRVRIVSDPAFGRGRGKTETILLRFLNCQEQLTYVSPATDQAFTAVADPAGWEIVAGPNQREFREAVLKIGLPPRELMLASCFAAQGGAGSFFEMGKGDRKELFVNMLGLSHLQELSEAAADRAKDGAATLDAELARLRELEEDQATLAGLQDTSQGYANLHARKRVEVEDETAAVERHQAHHGELSIAQAQEAEKLNHERERAQKFAGDLADLRVSKESFTDERGRYAALLARSESIQAAVSRKAELEEQRDALTDTLTQLERETVAPLEAAALTLAADIRRLDSQIQDKDGQIAGFEKAERELADSDVDEGLEAATRLCERIEADLSKIDLEGLLDRATVAARTKLTRDALETRVDTDRRRLEAFAKVDIEHPMCRVCPLTSDARLAVERQTKTAAELNGLPGPDPDAQAIYEQQRTFHRALLDQLKQAQATKEQFSGAVERNKAKQAALVAMNIAAVRDDLEGLQAEHVGKQFQFKERQRELEDAKGLRANHDKALRRLREEILELSPVAAKRDELVKAGARCEEIDRRIVEIDGKIRQLETEAQESKQAMDGLRANHAETAAALVEVATALAASKNCLTLARTELEQLAQAKTEVDAQLAALTKGIEGIEELRANVSRETKTVESWRLLARSLGRDGVQALEIDAAGPGVTSLANDLLETCYGPRFSLAIDTVQDKADGKGTKEVFEVRILDADNQREAKQGSGGEMVILDEALRLALAIYNAQQSGFEVRTLWRDETAGALSPENADKYVTMLRRARQLGGFHQIVFIAHQEHVWAQADARVEV